MNPDYCGPWKAFKRCANCHEVMSRSVEMYSNGVSPCCGFNDHSTVCRTRTSALRAIYKRRLFFWERWLGLDFRIAQRYEERV